MMADLPILVTRSSMPPIDEYLHEIAPLWDSHWLTNMGVKHCELEEKLKRRLDVNNIALFTNGHSALECVLEAMGLRGRVITTPFTFASTVHALVRKGLEPVFADVKRDDYTMDPECVERLVDSSTCAIMPVHVYGNLCDVDAFADIAKRYNLKVIYDAAHAFGVKRRNPTTGEWEGAASFGDASMLSFHATKVFNTIEGGAICFTDSKLKPLLDQWKNFGITGPEDVEYVGGNAKMNEFCAAMGICNLRHFDEELEKRRVVAEHYWELLDGIPGVKLCKPSGGIRPNYSYMPIVFEDTFCATRDDVFDELAASNIFARKYFYPLASDYACYRGRFDSAMTPVAREISSCVLTLPMYADLEFREIEKICRIVKKCAT